MLYDFQDKLFLEYRKLWFVWEPAWERFRPIEDVVWTGTTFQIKDDVYCKDPTDSAYGYGSLKMLQLCESLSAEGTPIKVSSLPIGNEWFRDRFVSFSPCASRDIKSWKRMVQNKPRTCRKAPRGKRFTRRILH